MQKFDVLRSNRNIYLKIFNQYQKFANEFQNNINKFAKINFELTKKRSLKIQNDTIYNIFQNKYDALKLKYQILSINEKKRENNNNDDTFVYNVAKKRRFVKYFDLFTFIDEMNFI